jgi:hypothetical protein
MGSRLTLQYSSFKGHLSGIRQNYLLSEITVRAAQDTDLAAYLASLKAGYSSV